MDAGYRDAEVTAIFSRTEDGYKSTHSLNENNRYEGLTIDHVFGNDKVYFLTHLIDRNEKTVTSSDHFPVVATAYIDFRSQKTIIKNNEKARLSRIPDSLVFLLLQF